MTRGGSGYQRSSMERSMLGESLRERMCPALMVLSTAAAEAACQRAELRRPAPPALRVLQPQRSHASSALIHVSLPRPLSCRAPASSPRATSPAVPVRTAGEHSYRLHDFRVRVFYASEIQQPSQEVPGGMGMHILANAENRTCWFQRFTDEFMRTLVFSDHETFDHPIACLLVASTSEPFPVRALRELMTPERLPALYRDGTMDPKLHLHYLLLHDCSSLGPPSASSQVELTIAEMRAAFGSPVCRLLPINSAAAPSQSRPDIWTKHRPVPVGGVAPPPPAGTALPQSPSGPPVSGAAGQYMSEADVREVADMMMELSVKHLVPHLERKARDLNQQISASRRGLRNQIKNLWFGKGKEESADATPGVYTYRSPESQIRQLADAAMMLQDFQLALDNYRLVAADYRRDKAWKHYAGAQGYSKIIGNCQSNAMYLKNAILDMGCFDILSKDVGVPLVTFALKEKDGPFNEYDIADVLKQFGWIIPAYTMAPDLEHVTMLRALVREDFSRSLADRFLNDVRMTLKILEDRGATVPRTVTPAAATAAAPAVSSIPEEEAPVTAEVPKPKSRMARDLAADEAYVLSPLAGTRLMPPNKLEYSHSMDSSALRQRTFRVFKKNSIAKTNGVC
ncbi:unnamed protein product [Closterium sp. Naga37s-1]|nr:unnamed protein product [Closterium sp. Naga37s-1]